MLIPEESSSPATIATLGQAVFIYLYLASVLYPRESESEKVPRPGSKITISGISVGGRFGYPTLIIEESLALMPCGTSFHFVRSIRDAKFVPSPLPRVKRRRTIRNFIPLRRLEDKERGKSSLTSDSFHQFLPRRGRCEQNGIDSIEGAAIESNRFFASEEERISCDRIVTE
ncbi:hypothetical protein L1987_89197 [Smallanthus sonchifolius]|nr:hypothetical protein L1987_89197 [Smallanthus sonchifolius]